MSGDIVKNKHSQLPDFPTELQITTKYVTSFIRSSLISVYYNNTICINMYHPSMLILCGYVLVIRHRNTDATFNFSKFNSTAIS